MSNFNQTMYALGARRSVIRELFEYATARKREIGEENVFDFSLGNPSVPCPDFLTKTIKELIENTPPEILHGYTSAAGAPIVRQKISDYIRKKFNFTVPPSLVYMTCGAAAALVVTLAALVEQGDEVIVFSPFFPEYRVFVENVGAKLVPVKCTEADFSVDYAALSASITPRTKAVIVNSPNNPTGKVLFKSEIERLCAVLNDRANAFGTHVYLLADEPYREIAYDSIEVPYLPSYYNDAVVCYSFSKSLSLPGERIGYVAVSPKAHLAEQIYAAICGAGRAHGYVCAPSLWQYAVAECLGQSSDLSIYKRNRDTLYSALTEIGYRCVNPDGAFYLFVKSPIADATAFCEQAKKHELILVPSDDFDYPGYVRISYCVDPKTIERALPAFRALYRDYFSEK